MAYNSVRRKSVNFDLQYLEELITITGTVVTGVLIPLAGWFWIKVVKPLTNLLRRQEAAMEAIKDLQDEITAHGGKTIKDTVKTMRKNLVDVQISQRVIKERCKAALNYADVAMFETDKSGKLIWGNNMFYDLDSLDSLNTSVVKGFDWVSLLRENDQQETLEQFKSCLEMNRTFVRQTRLSNGRPIRMQGHPLRISDDQNDGFLMSISLTKN